MTTGPDHDKKQRLTAFAHILDKVKRNKEATDTFGIDIVVEADSSLGPDFADDNLDRTIEKKQQQRYRGDKMY